MPHVAGKVTTHDSSIPDILAALLPTQLPAHDLGKAAADDWYVLVPANHAQGSSSWFLASARPSSVLGDHSGNEQMEDVSLSLLSHPPSMLPSEYVILTFK